MLIKQIDNFEQLKELYDKNLVAWDCFIANSLEKLVGLLNSYQKEKGYIVYGDALNKIFNTTSYKDDDCWMIIEDNYNPNYYEGVSLINLIDSKFVSKVNPFKYA